jgi:hypothetical protein
MTSATSPRASRTKLHSYVELNNIAGITLGPPLPDGRESVVLVSESHCSPHVTQLVAFAL